MNSVDYIKNVLKTETTELSKLKHRLQDESIIRLLHAGLGVCTEAGEFNDMLKKAIYYGKDLDRINLIEELGDLLWYIAIACDELGISINRVMELNIEKLQARYEGSFTETKANKRNLEKERTILEK